MKNFLKNRSTDFKLALIALTVGGLAWAATETLDRITSVNPQHFIKGLYVGTEASRAAADTKNKVKHTGADLVDYTFGALPDDGGTTGVACQLSVPSATVEGAQVGDPCFVGVRAPSTPSNDLNTNLFSCVVTASNTVKVRRCGDRGAAALTDSGFEVRTIGYK